MHATRQVQRILIANRGEIARRIIRTCDHLGIESVAVFSDVDVHAPFVREATFAEPLGEPLNYLSIEQILAAAKRSGADSVHPGYGFLSENAAFAEAVDKAGLIFIGPKAHSIRALGSKTSAKELAIRANVPVSPTLIFTSGSIDARCAEVAAFGASVGFPLLIKAAAGGGGRGMRMLSAGSNIKAELESAERESLKAFGSGEIFVEKYIAPARHIEVQIAGDSLGHIVALGTRDCSLQRSNQKILEEAPAIQLKPGVREELCQAACRLAKEARYTNLGTVEFLYSPDGLFYFLEVNTRLQVEHPVTEMVTGLDLVRLQIGVAEGRSLSECGADPVPQTKGHAIEARLCAEEFTGQFVTGTGIVLDVAIPERVDVPGSVRADMGVEVCSEVTHHYDSLLGKLIVHADCRDDAIRLLTEVLRHSRVSGVPNNRSLLLHLVATDEFRSLRHSIQGTAALLPAKSQYEAALEEAHVVAAAVRAVTPLSTWMDNSPWLTPEARRLTPISYPYSTATYGTMRVSTTSDKDESLVVQVGDRSYEARILSWRQPTPLSVAGELSLNGAAALPFHILHDGATTWVDTARGSYHLTEQHRSARAAGDSLEASGAQITSTIPGKVAAVLVSEGEAVSAGTTLLVLDSMKMEHPIRALNDGVVASLPIAVGTVVQAGSVLVVMR